MQGSTTSASRSRSPSSASTVTVAGSDGNVLALSVDDGRTLWRAQTGTPINAGVGSDIRVAAVVTRDNELVVFDRAANRSGVRGSARASTTAPLVAGERVFVVSVDRVVTPSTRSTAAGSGRCSVLAMH